MTDRYAVFGNPIAHSKSPIIHAEFAKQTGEDIVYERQLVDTEQGKFHEAVRKFFDDGGCGLNITVPFKIDALDFVYRFHGCMVSERAERARAVNTLKKMPDGTIFGDNTDGAGLLRDITKNLGWVVKNKRVLVLGAGGAVRGVMQPLMNESPQLVVVANRTLWKAQEIIEDYVDKFSILAADLVNPIEPFDLVINGTSASLGGEMLQLSPTILAPNACCYDMMYSKELTPFLQWAKHHGAQVADGLGMLVEQAAESFYVWRGVMPATKPVMELLR